EEEWPGAELGCEECDGGRIRRMARFNPDDFSIVVIDECFPAGTLIDGRPIESIRPGDRVRSVNHATGEIEMRRVVRAMKSRPRMTCTVRFASGRELFCTTGHPFWVAGVGY